MRSLEQIIRDNMTEEEREEYDSISLQRRMVTQNYIEALDELDRKKREIIFQQKKELNMA